MAFCCRPETTQIFDSSQPDSSNSYRFRVPPGQSGQMEVSGLCDYDGAEVELLVQDPDDPTSWVPYLVDGEPWVFDCDNPEIDLPPGLYRVVPNQEAQDAAGVAVTVSAFNYPDVGLTSVAALYGTCLSNALEIEIVRVSEFGPPRYFYAGTDDEVEGVDPSLVFFPGQHVPNRFVSAATYTDDETFTIGVGQTRTLQNRTGASVFYGYNPANMFELVDRAVVTLSAVGTVTLQVPAVFEPDTDNPGVISHGFNACL